MAEELELTTLCREYEKVGYDPGLVRYFTLRFIAAGEYIQALKHLREVIQKVKDGKLNAGDIGEELFFRAPR